jgi:hypothetical protein
MHKKQQEQLVVFCAFSAQQIQFLYQIFQIIK